MRNLRRRRPCPHARPPTAPADRPASPRPSWRDWLATGAMLLVAGAMVLPSAMTPGERPVGPDLDRRDPRALPTSGDCLDQPEEVRRRRADGTPNIADQDSNNDVHDPGRGARLRPDRDRVLPDPAPSPTSAPPSAPRPAAGASPSPGTCRATSSPPTSSTSTSADAAFNTERLPAVAAEPPVEDDVGRESLRQIHE